MDPLSGLRTVIGDPDAGWDGGGEQPRPDPLGGGRGEPELFAGSPGAGTLEVIDHRRALVEQDAAELAATMGGWRERMRAHADAAYVHLIVNEDGPGPGRTHAARAAVRARRGGARARALHRLPRTHPGPQPAGRPAAGGGPPPRAAGGRGRGRGGHLPVRLARRPSTCRSCRAERGRGSRTRGRLGAETLHDVLRRADAPCSAAPPPFDMWVRTAPPGATAFCWRIDLVPRPSAPDGLEAGAGVQLTSLAAARRRRTRLRDAALR